MTDKWLSGRGRSEQQEIDSRDVWGSDPYTGEIIRSIYDGSGTYAVVRSPGWVGDKLVLEGDARSANGVVRVRETIQRQGANRFEAIWEARREGKWSPYSIETAVRNPSGHWPT